MVAELRTDYGFDATKDAVERLIFGCVSVMGSKPWFVSIGYPPFKDCM